MCSDWNVRVGANNNQVMAQCWKPYPKKYFKKTHITTIVIILHQVGVTSIISPTTPHYNPHHYDPPNPTPPHPTLPQRILYGRQNNCTLWTIAAIVSSIANGKFLLRQNEYIFCLMKRLISQQLSSFCIWLRYE